MKLHGLDRRIGTLEARQPPVKSDTQKFLEKLTYEELCQLQMIAEKKENGGVPTSEESVFLDELEAKHGFIPKTE
jgi:hypothetical protein